MPAEGEDLQNPEVEDRSYVLQSAFEYFDPLSQDTTITAAYNKDLPMLKHLVQHGFSVNTPDNRGFTALHIAVSYELLDMIDYLINETNIILDFRDSMDETALFKSMDCVRNEPALKLLRAGADVNIPSSSSLTPLHEAVRKKPEVAQLLVERGADLNARGRPTGFTPLHTAVETNSYAMVCMLLYYGADATVVDVFGMTPFMRALKKGSSEEIQELLLEYEVDVNLVDHDGYNHLLLAMKRQNPLALHLIERGADVNYHEGTKNVANFVFVYEDDETFERIWNVMKPSLVEETKSSSDFLFDVVVSWKSRYKRLQTILSSDKAEAFVQKHLDIFTRTISLCTGKNLEEDKLYPLVCACLMYGAAVTYRDFCLLYDYYGYNKIVKLLLHVGIIVPTSDNISLPYLICSVSRVRSQGCLMCAAQESGEKRKMSLELFQHVSVFFVMCNECASDLGVDVAVPSLKEFAREATRCAIGEGFKGSTLMFYTVVQNLAIPDVLKKFIGYEVAI